MPGVVGVKRKRVSREAALNSKVYCRITLECGHVLSHILVARSDRSQFHYCQECLEEKQSA